MKGLSVGPELTSAIEQLAASGWPPSELESLGTWKLRANGGVTTRANSVLAAGPFPESEWLERVERFYRERGLPPCFHVSDSSPKELDGLLAAAGYEVSMNCLLLAASIQQVLQRSAAYEIGEAKVTLAAQPEEPWMNDFLRMEGFPEERRAGYLTIFKAMPKPKTFATIYEAGEPMGVATVVIEEGWAGISNVVVDPRHRRKGVAGRLLQALASWAAEHGAEGMYLQVLAGNAPALELYGKLGFETISGYHYRIRK
ncbi:GNAT family N-acetyltransferase [Paenibacillus sp. DXFW5]|uniref:GNAT family N-acetyltransferase n=1 Tax=Paenibacillus rhizolycopersici TaxID=2780073 RepID=A0ABS2H0B6_9BACL|nr:GNAT family N-acetyltransferase [Paenibacillus rhizolycopersici]MBM6994702.1 GNAT family N-acetyltransferase [Paenibacillus rhizolycopersici]